MGMKLESLVYYGFVAWSLSNQLNLRKTAFQDLSSMERPLLITSIEIIIFGNKGCLKNFV